MYLITKCPRCGTEFSGKRCNICGYTLNKNSMKPWHIVLIVVVAILAIGVVNSIINSPSTVDTTKSTGSSSAYAVAATEAATEQVTQKINTTKSESKDEYINACKEIAYNDLARDPDKYKGQKIKITIKIQQVLSGGLLTESGYRGYEDYEIDFENENSTFLKKEWYVDLELSDSDSKILEDDVITFYGEYNGTEALKRALTNTTDYVPVIDVKYYSLVEAAD